NIEPIYNAVVIGEKISQKNIDNCDKVIIINKSLEKKLNKNIGDKVIINDANFEIIGIENDSSIKGDYIYFPYTTILSLKIKSTDLIFQMKNDFFENDFSILDSAIKKQGIAYKQIKYPEISSELMERFAFKMITSFVVVLLAIVNFIYLFKYYLNKRQKDYSIYSITGLSKASIAIMFTVEGIIMFILSFLLAIGLFYLLYIVFITNIFKLTPLIYGFSEILEVFIFSFIFTLILIIIILFFLLKKSSISNYKEMEGM
ncbi:MAG: ABC transporter permease, partial [Oscillospiraceae bacterium]